MAEGLSGEDRAFVRALVDAAVARALVDVPTPTFWNALCVQIGPPGPDGQVGILKDGEDSPTFAQVVGGILPQIGARVYGVQVPPHGSVILGIVGTAGNNISPEDWQGLGGATPTDSLVAAAFTPWPLLMSVGVAIPPSATRMIAEAQLTGIEQTAASGRFELQQVTAAGVGAIHRAASATGGAWFGIVISEEYDVSAFAGGVISARLDGRRAAGAGSLDYTSGSRGRWLFRFYDT